MNFNSIEEIISHFEFDVIDKDEIKKELKKLIQKVHPDKNKGAFKTESEKSFFMEIQSALEFLGNGDSNASLATKNDITALAKVLTDLALTRKDEIASENIENKRSSLTSKLQDSVASFHKQGSTPKITSLIITTIISAIWIFPNVVKGHPLLGFLYTFNTQFTIVWICSLIIMAMLWIKIKSLEKKDEEIKRSYKLESTQNYIFSLFSKWFTANNDNYDIVDDKRRIKFTKDDMINFLVTRYNYFQKRMRGTENKRWYEVQKIIREIEENEKFQFETQRRGPILNLFSFLPKPGEIDLEIAQLICDLIIDRLEAKGVIVKSKAKSLSDIYVFDEED